MPCLTNLDRFQRGTFMQVTMSVAIMGVLSLYCHCAGGAFCYSYVGGSFCCNQACEFF